jgi:hypothetical protein
MICELETAVPPPGPGREALIAENGDESEL